METEKEKEKNETTKIEMPLPKTQVATPEVAVAPEIAETLTKAINTLIAKTVELIITLDEDECAKDSKYNKPCETCRSLSELKAPVRTIIRLSKQLSKKEGV